MDQTSSLPPLPSWSLLPKRSSEKQLQLALIDTSLEKLPIRNYNDEQLRQYVQKWQQRCGGGTKVWQNVWADVSSLDPNVHKDASVIVITDGLDNTSEGKFKGPEGAHYLVEQLRRMKIEHVTFNIVGIGKLDKAVSAVFENISSLSGGMYQNIKDVSDLAAFTQKFVKPFAEAVMNPTIGAIRCRERQVDAKVSVGIFDGQVQNVVNELREENSKLKAAAKKLTDDNQVLREANEGLKGEVKQLQDDGKSMKDDIDNLKKMFAEAMAASSRPSTASTAEPSAELPDGWELAEQ